MIVIFTPDGLTIGVAGLILKLIDPFESAQVAGEGTGVITTVAQVPVPPPPPVQPGLVDASTFINKVLFMVQPPLTYITEML